MNRVRKIIAKLLIAVFLITGTITQPIAFAAKRQDKPNVDRAKTEILVKYKDAQKADNTNAAVKGKLKLSRLDAKMRFSNPKFEVVEIDSTDNITNVVDELKKDPNVEYAQLNYKLNVMDSKPDDLYPQEWGLSNTAQNINGITGTSGVDINAEKAWTLTKGNTSTVVGILDTGIDITHSDLANNIYINPGEIPGNGLDDDGNGYVDDVYGWDFANNDNTVYDSAADDKHGTHVAGIIAAGADNGGIKGVAPGVKVIPLKFITSGGGFTSDAIEAIEYAKTMGVKIINCSFGSAQENQALKDAMASSGILFICSSGNSSSDTAKSPVYPAAFNLPNIISVASINSKGELASFSNYGTDVDVAAPGVNILSTVPGSSYEMGSGTSMSAAFVTGIAGLLESKYTDMTIDEMAARIKNNIVVSSLLNTKVATQGYVDAYGALTGTVPPADSRQQQNQSTTKNNTNQDTKLDILAATVSATLLEQIHYGENGVNIASGNYSRSETDISVDAPGFKVNISRTYNSKDSRPSSTMGRGWTFGFEGSLKQDTQNTSLWVAKLPNGSSQVFVLSGTTYTANDSRSTLVKNADNTYTLTTKDQYSYGFNTSGYLQRMNDKNGNTILITVDSSGKVQKITDTVGRIFTVTYTNGYITSVTDPLGRQATYEYDANNHLKKAYLKSPSGTIEGSVEEYRYDTLGFLDQVKITDKVTGNTRVDQALVYSHSAGANLDKVTTYTDKYNNTSTYVYDTANKKTTVTDTTGRQLVKWYDANLYTIKSQDPEGKIASVDYFLDSGNNNIYGEERVITDRNGNKTTYVRDDLGNITEITNPDNSAREYTYDSKNNLLMEKDEEGNRTYYVYDSTGTNLLKKAQPINGTDVYTQNSDQTKYAVTYYSYYTPEEAAQMGVNAKGLLKSVTDPEGGVTTYTYDKYGNILTVTNPLGNTTTNEHNIIGWVTATISPMHYRTEYTYDNYGRVVRTILDGGETSRIVYNGEGQKIKEIPPNQYDMSLDALNDAVCGYDYRGDNVGATYTYDPKTALLKTKTQYPNSTENYTTTYTYNIYGSLETETEPNNSRYYYEYDVMNRLKKTSFKNDVNNSLEQPAVLDEYSYLTLTDGRTQNTHTQYLNDTDTAVTTDTFDYAGRKVETLRPDGSRAYTKYNANGTVFSATDGNGATIYFKYDGLLRLTAQWEPIDSGKYMYTGYKYDKAGRIVEELKGRDKVELNGIPASDRLSIKTYEYNLDGTVKSQSDSTGGKTSFSYDLDGNLTEKVVSINDDTSNTTQYTYNHMKKPVSVRVFADPGDIYQSHGQIPIVLETTYEYDHNGNLIETTTPDGNTTTYTYDALNRQTGTSTIGLDQNGNPAAITTSVKYDSNGNVLESKDPNGNTTWFTYDQRGNLLTEKKTYQDENNATQDVINTYCYDLAGRKTIAVSAQNYTSSADPLTNMNRTEFTYDKMGRVKTQKEIYRLTPTDSWTSFVSKAYKYDAEGNVIKELDGMGYAAGAGATDDAKISTGYGTKYTYYPGGHVATVLDPVSAERGLAFTTKYTYDGMGRKATEENGNLAVTCYQYDDNGNATQVSIKKTESAPAQTIKTMKYDLAGNLSESTDANDNTTIYEYNSIDKVKTVAYPGDQTIPTKTVTSSYDIMGRLAAAEDSTGFVDLYTYDLQGRDLSHTQQAEDGSQAITVSKAYDLNGNTIYETDGNGVTKTNSYDNLNRLTGISVTAKTADNRTVVHTTTYRYDKNNNKLKEINWLGNAYSYEYDPVNRLVKKYDPENSTPVQTLEYNYSHVQVVSRDFFGNETSFAYDKDNRLIATTDVGLHITRQDYDNTGNVSSKTDALGNTTSYLYDQFNRLVSVTDAMGQENRYIYDLNGNLITQTDGNGNVTTYEYNAANKPIKKIDNGGRTGNKGSFQYDAAKIESYTYNADASLKTKLDRNGVTTTYEYDIHGRLTLQKAGDDEISYTYDNNGNQLTMTDSTGTTVRTYDALNRVVTKYSPGFATTVFNYDINNDSIRGVSKEQFAEESKDPKGNITLKVYDKAGRLLKVKDGNDINFTVYQYDGNGNRLQTTYPDGAKEIYTYDSENLLLNLTNEKADETVIEQFTYTYDVNHNQKTKTDAKGVTSYEYDGLNRLSQVTEDYINNDLDTATSYTYDAAGNRLTESVVKSGTTTLTSYEYNDQNRLFTTTVKTGGTKETTKYNYDNNGNMTSKTYEKTTKIDPANTPTPHFGMFIPGQGATEHAQPIAQNIGYYEYDLWNQMVKATTGNSKAEYKYNGDGLRVEKDVNGAKTRYLYEYDQVVLETDGNGREAARNVYGTNLISRKVSSEKLYYLYNGHADVTALIDNTGTVQASYYYDAFGTPITAFTNENNKNNPIRYSGYDFDGETGLYYLNSRMYDPKIARFMQEDTYCGSVSDPLSLNLYTYCTNNPIMYVDPTGHAGTLSQGSKGDGVKAVQELLIDLGYDLGKSGADGVFGSRTDAAIEQFQKAHGLQVDGIVGNQTLTWLKAYASTQNTPDYVTNQVMASAARNAQAGAIRDDAILMSTGTFNQALNNISTLQRDTGGGSINTTISNNQVGITGANIPTSSGNTVTISAGTPINAASPNLNYAIFDSEIKYTRDIVQPQKDTATFTQLANTVQAMQGAYTATINAYYSVAIDHYNQMKMEDFGPYFGDIRPELDGLKIFVDAGAVVVDSLEYKALLADIYMNGYDMANLNADSYLELASTDAGGALVAMAGIKEPTGGNFVAEPGMTGYSYMNQRNQANMAKSTQGSNVADEFVNLASPSRTTHILYGDKTGGGHMWPGQPGKTTFPESWSAGEVMQYISDIVTDPNLSWQKGRVVNGIQRYEVLGVREGVQIKVITDGTDIITAYPLK